MQDSYFISDLHLDASKTHLLDLFQYFIEKIAISAKNLYILGDFFEAWIGDDAKDHCQQTVLHLLKNLSNQGTAIFIMRGNRDFLLNEKFCKACHAELLPDPTIIRINRKKIILSHGDMLCTDDIWHQRFRTIAYKKYFHFWFLWLPLCLRQWLAKLIRNLSKNQTKKKLPQIMDVNQQAVGQILTENIGDILIHGHTHRPGIHQIKNQPFTRIVLGAWHDTGNYLKFTADGQYEWVEFTNQ